MNRLFGWTFDEWSHAFGRYPVEGEMTFAKALNTKLRWVRRGFGDSPVPSSLVLPDGVAPTDPAAACALFALSPSDLVGRAEHAAPCHGTFTA